MDPEQAAGGGGWPDIGDYWPDVPQGPVADRHVGPVAEPTRSATAGPTLKEPGGRGRAWFLIALAATALVLLGGGLVAFGHMTSSPVADPGPVRPTMVTVPEPTGSAGPASVLPSLTPTRTARTTTATPKPSPTTTAPPPTRSAGGSIWSTGTFLLADDVTGITLSMARVDHGIARVGVPDGSNAVPRTSVDGTTLRLGVDTAGRGDKRVIVQLDDRISWAIRLGGGAHQASLHLDGASLRSLAFDGGAGTLDVTLPRLRSTLPIQLGAGVGTWRIGTDGQVAVDLVAHKGGGSLVLYGDDKGSLHHGERAAVEGRAGIDVTADAGFGSLTVTDT